MGMLSSLAGLQRRCVGRRDILWGMLLFARSDLRNKK